MRKSVCGERRNLSDYLQTKTFYLLDIGRKASLKKIKMLKEGDSMRCSRCGKEIAVKKIKGLGALCYWCFDLAVLKMLGIKEVWLEEEIIPMIKQEIADQIIKDDSFSVQVYIENSVYGEEIIKHAISDMLDLDMLAENVRKVLNAYRGELLGEYFGEEE